MMSLQFKANCACVLFLASAFGFTFGDKRCSVAGGGSCFDPSSRAVRSDATGSMLQVKVGELHARQSPMGKAGELDEGNVEDIVHKLESELETQFGATAQEAMSGIENLSADLVSAEEKAAEAAQGQMNEATDAVGEQIETVEKEGLTAIKGVSDAALNQIDVVASSLGNKLSEVELELKTSKTAVDDIMADGVHDADGAIETAAEVLEETVGNFAPTAKLKDDLSEVVKQAVGPYVAVAETSLEAQKDEVSAVLSEVSNEAGDLGEEIQGIAGQFVHAAKTGVHAAITGAVHSAS